MINNDNKLYVKYIKNTLNINSKIEFYSNDIDHLFINNSTLIKISDYNFI